MIVGPLSPASRSSFNGAARFRAERSLTRPLGPAERQSLLHDVAEKQHQREGARRTLHAETMALLTGHLAAAMVTAAADGNQTSS
jgi:hypothetical protein